MKITRKYTIGLTFLLLGLLGFSSLSFASMEKDVDENGFNLKKTSPLSYEQVSQMTKELKKLEANEYVQQIPSIKKDFELFILTQKNKCLASKANSPNLSKSCFDKIRESTYAFIDASFEARKSYFDFITKQNLEQLVQTKELIKNDYKRKLGEK
jgi:nitrate reductase cytochrome c-type subunit